MERINGGYLALIVVGLIFFGLQVWWIGMTLRNGISKRGLINDRKTSEMKKKLEKIFQNNS